MIVWGLGIALTLGGSAPGRADQAVRIASVRIGFNGLYKAGHWTPVWVTLENAGPSIEVDLRLGTRDGDGVPAVFRRPEDQRLRLNAAGSTVALRYVKAGRVGGRLSVSVVGEQEELAARTFGLDELGSAEPSTCEVLVGLAPGLRLDEAVRKARRDQTYPIALATVDDAQRLPDAWYGYDGADVVVATTSTAGVLEQLTDAQFMALDHWLRLGGRLVLCGGQRGAEVLAPPNRLARFSPGRTATAITQRATSGLESYAGASERLDSIGGQRARRFGVPMTALSDVRGVIEAAEVGGPMGRLPTIIRFPYGLGQITFLAFDPELPPFDQWQGRTALMARVLQLAGMTRRAGSDVDLRMGQVAHLGYEDLAGQLWSALDQFSGVTRVQFSWVAGLLAVYIALVGPIDYLVLRRFRGQSWTWLTSSLVVAAFCGLAYVGMRHLSGQDVHVNHVDVVDVDLEQGVRRGSSWTHLYSPATRKFALDWKPTLALAAGAPESALRSEAGERPAAGFVESTAGASAEARSTPVPGSSAPGSSAGGVLAWQGLPGSGMGGLESRIGSGLFTEPYTMTLGLGGSSAPTAEIDELPIEVSGTKSLGGVWWSLSETTATQRLRASPHGLLAGQLINPLDCELTECMVVYENWMYPVTGTLTPGKAVSFDGVSPRNLEWHLSRRRVVDTKDVGTPWDQAGVDVPRIMEMMMFYQAAGGAAYTRLTHRYESRLDLSDHLRTGRAILVGRSTAAGSSLASHDRAWDASHERRWAFYRVVFPVDRSERAAAP